MRWMAALALAACGSAQPPQPVHPPPEVTARQVFDHLRARAYADPLFLMNDLAIPEREYERFARRLYEHWKSKQPAPVAPVRPTVPAPPPAPTRPVVVPVPPTAEPLVNLRFWCFDANGGVCDEDLESCNSRRADVVRNNYCTPGLTKQQCIDIAASVRDITPCRYQERASCFVKHMVLWGRDEFGCAPTVRECKALRATALRQFSDDIKVKSDCTTIE